MYKRFFYLNEKPFNITPGLKFLYMGKSHTEALDILMYGVEERKGFVLLTGEVGTGKTTLCKAFIESLKPGTESAMIFNPMLSEQDLANTIIGDFGLKTNDRALTACINALNSFLIQTASNGKTAVLIIDESQNLKASTLEFLRMLSNLETEKEKLLQIILVGQPELEEKLSMTPLRQLNQRIALRQRLLPLSERETGEYILSRIKTAGGGSTVKFTGAALKAVHRASGGVPRIINIVADRSLTAAFIKEKRLIEGTHVRRAVKELRSEGYLPGRAATVLEQVHGRYFPHIALTVFVAAAIAGFFLWPHFSGISTALAALR